MSFKARPAVWVPLVAFALAGCDGGRPDPLRLGDLSDAERLYLTRFVTLERARAVALVDASAGEALLDSLARAWGDSSAEPLVAGLSGSPSRVARLHDLLERILAAEADSLLQAPSARRLAAPLPDPPPPRAGG